MTDPVCKNCGRPASEHSYLGEKPWICPTAQFEAVEDEVELDSPPFTPPGIVVGERRNRGK